MIKKTIKYKNLFTDEEVEEDLYFHLSKADLIELDVSEDGLDEVLKKIIAAKDNKSLYDLFTKVVLMAYGKRSEDSRYFIKNQQLRDEFRSSEAFSELITLLAQDPEFQIEFVNGIIPADLRDEDATAVAPPEADPTAIEPENSGPRIVTRKELREMNAEEVNDFVAKVRAGEAQIEE